MKIVNIIKINLLVEEDLVLFIKDHGIIFNVQ
jgi:hypothetical protein